MAELHFIIGTAPEPNPEKNPGLAVFFNGCIDEISDDALQPYAEALALLLRDLNPKKSRDCTTMPLPEETGFTRVALFNMVPEEGAKPDPLPTFEQIKTVASEAMKIGQRAKAKRVAFFLGKRQAALVGALVAEGATLGTYSFSKYKSTTEDTPVETVTVELIMDETEVGAAESQVPESVLVAKAANFARDLINESPGVMKPHKLADVIAERAEHLGLECEIMDRAALQAEGYGGILGVGQGAASGPYLAVLRYSPADVPKDAPHLALVGKGVTFDTGGLCLKTPTGMADMKADMTGAAVVFAATCAIAELGLPARVTTVIPIVENAMDNHSYLPGDILITKSGKTVHVENTDAEGRLILADALWRAGQEGATHIVDIATLTGAIVYALGNNVAGLFSNDDEFGPMLLEAGDAVGEDMWQLPLWQEYREQLQHHLADLNNVGKGKSGSITAALFLQEFVPEDTKWAHLDIAGVDTVETSWRYYDKGATAFGVRTMVALAELLNS